uniref:hypothetical protein n=1 Tax=Mycobacterium tuberculosis TaxID=1773 RepID=UPI00254FD59F
TCRLRQYPQWEKSVERPLGPHKIGFASRRLWLLDQRTLDFEVANRQMAALPSLRPPRARAAAGCSAARFRAAATVSYAEPCPLPTI